MMIVNNRLERLFNLLDFSYLNKDWITEEEIKKYLNCNDEESFFILQKLRDKYQITNVPMIFFINEFQINFNKVRNERYHNSLVQFLNNLKEVISCKEV